MSVRMTALALALGMPLAAPAQPDESSREQEPQALPEEVLIIGERSMLQLRTQMWAAEKMAYDIFNRFNDESRFSISCSQHQPTGTRIARQICQPEFQRGATAAHGRAYWESYRALLDPNNLDYSPQVTHQPAEAVIARQQPEFQRKMRQVAEEHPEFLEALIQYGEIRKMYEEAAATGANAD